MKFLIRKIYIILFLMSTLLFGVNVFAKESKIQYTKENISNYFSGIVSANYADSKSAFKHLKKVQSLKNHHSNYNIQFLRTLVLLEKFEQAFEFAKNAWRENELFFEADLMIGLYYFLKQENFEAEKHFKRLNNMYKYDIVFQNLVGNVLLSLTKASENNEIESLQYLNKIPDRYFYLKKIQKSFIYCHFGKKETENLFRELIENEDYDFSRYSFFLVSTLLHDNKNLEAKKIIDNLREKHFSNLLINQTGNLILNNKLEKVKNFFNCKNPKDVIAEFLYIIANLHANEKDYELSNFYLKISLFINNKFEMNKTLLAENLYYQKKYKLSENVFYSLKPISETYSWHSSKSIASILLDTVGKERSISSLKKEFDLLKNRNFKHYYEMANFYKDNEYFEESIKYYSLALQNINSDHYLFPKILDRRGSSFERIGEWEKAEKDLTESLKILPDEPYVLNYLAYSWVEKKINLDKALEMLRHAVSLKENDGYIIDSLGWAYYAKKDYIKAEKFLREAVKLKPEDPVINDHYADSLWMLNKDIQARYVWKYVLSLDDIKEELRDNVNNKLTFGITNES